MNRNRFVKQVVVPICLAAALSMTAMVAFWQGQLDARVELIRARALRTLERCDRIQQVTRFADGSESTFVQILSGDPEFSELANNLRKYLGRRGSRVGTWSIDERIEFVVDGQVSEITMVIDGNPSQIDVIETTDRPIMVCFPLDQSEFAAIVETLTDAGTRLANSLFFYPTGERRAVGSFVRDQQEGLWTFYRRDGTKECSGDFRRGERSGTWYFWDEAGAQTQREYSEEGER
jgi:hypothetical protein